MTDLNWFGWVVLVLWVASTLTSVGTVGKPRRPLEPGTAAVITLINGLLIAGLIFVGTQS